MPIRTCLARAALVGGALAVLIASAIASPFVKTLEVDALIARLATEIRDNYVFPDKGAEAADMLERNALAGAYEGLQGMELAQKLTEDLRELTKDRHFGVRPAPAEAPEAGPAAATPARRSSPIRSVERLEGNIGYIDFRGFEMRASIEPRVHAMMSLLEGSDALIIDLRRNGGGDPETVQLLCSYLFDKESPVHLNSLYFRPADETTEYWTQPDTVQGEGFAQTPVWVLTSRSTFSAAEEFSYNLKTRKRATIVGETTGGGAHPVDGFRVGEFVAMIPVGRAINPLTGTNWEGTGVEPDVKVQAEEALEVALNLAMETLAQSEDPTVAAEAEWALLARRSATNPVSIPEPQLATIAGSYGDRQLTLRDGNLWYARTGVSAAEKRLVPVSENIFVIEGTPGFRLEVERAADGSVTGLRGVYQAGHSDYSRRAG